MADYKFEFKSNAYPDDQNFRVLSFDGRETISELFHYNVKVVSQHEETHFEEIENSTVQLKISCDESKEPKYVNGIVKSFSLAQVRSNGLFEYNISMVPNLWIKTQSKHTQRFSDKSTLDVISEILNDNNALDEPEIKTNDLFESMGLIESVYDKKEFILQYDESDYSFVSRLMLEDGLYYFFEHTCEGETLIVADCNDDLFSIQGTLEDTLISYLDINSVNNIGSSVAVNNITSINTAHCEKLFDIKHNETETNKVESHKLSESLSGYYVDDQSLASRFISGNQSDEERDRISRVREEKQTCQKNMFSGKGNVSNFTAGAHFTLVNSIDGDFDQKYLLTSVNHYGSQDIPSWNRTDNAKYTNSFDCIPFEIPFRKDQYISTPKIKGAIEGVVVASLLDETVADVDRYGRYQVEMQLKVEGMQHETVTHYIAMTQPLTENNNEIVELLPEDKVLVSFLYEDINRPIIVRKL